MAEGIVRSAADEKIATVCANRAPVAFDGCGAAGNIARPGQDLACQATGNPNVRNGSPSSGGQAGFGHCTDRRPTGAFRKRCGNGRAGTSV